MAKPVGLPYVYYPADAYPGGEHESITIYNIAPMLSWPDITTDRITLGSGQSVNFTVDYSDPEANAPQYIQLGILNLSGNDIEYFDMEKTWIDFGYDVAVKYECEVFEGAYPLTENGSYFWFFRATDGAEWTRYPAQEDTYLSGLNITEAPTLTMANVSADPTLRYSGDPIVFKITYTSLDNLAPTEDPKLTVFDNTGTKIVFGDTMTKVNPSDTSYSDGCVYQAQNTEGVGPFNFQGLLAYYIVAKAGSGNSLRFPEENGEFLWSSIAEAPVILSPTIFPASVKYRSGEDVWFKFGYRDKDNDLPEFTRLYIALPGTSSFRSYSMTRGDNDPPSSGTNYYLHAKEGDEVLPINGTYQYYFQTSDGNFTARYPAMEGTCAESNVENTAPTFSNLQLNHYAVAYGSGTNVTFNITYTDLDNTAPVYVKVTLFNPDGTSPGSYTMFRQDTTDNDYSDGVVYQFTVQEGSGRLVGLGTHQYAIKASDGMCEVRYPATANSYFNDLSVVNTAPTLGELTGAVASHASVAAGSGQVVTFQVNYTDPEDNEPEFVRLHVFAPDGISSVTFTMTKENAGDEDYNDGVTYIYQLAEGTVPLTGQGTIKFYFEASDGLLDARLPGSTTEYYQTLEITNSAPTLSSPSASATSLERYCGQDVMFQVNFTDSNNDAPTQITLHLLAPDGTTWWNATMTKLNTGDDDYRDGVIYYCNMTAGIQQLAQVGTYTYFFSASDGNFQIQLLDTGSIYFSNFQVTASDDTTPSGSDTKPSTETDTTWMILGIVGLCAAGGMAGVLVMFLKKGPKAPRT